MWAVDLMPSGWRVWMGDRARGQSWAEFRPDRHGRVKKMQSSADAKVTLAAVQAACAAVREEMPPNCCGGLFYGTGTSLLREEFCRRVAALLNGEGA